jgi:LacI family transcriptional regulator
MATIKDVAALAGISYTTVSHVLNKTRPVSEHVRLKVEAAIKTLDYVPSAVARSLKAKTTATIGLLVPNSLNPYFAELARGIEDYCERNGYCVILCNSDDDPDKQRSYLRVLLEKRIDGLIVASAGGDSSLAQGLAGVRTPMVIVDRAWKVSRQTWCASITSTARIWRPATCWSWGIGTSPPSARPTTTSVAQMRLAGFCRA